MASRHVLPAQQEGFPGFGGTSRYVQAIFGRHSQLEGALQFCRLSSVGIHGEDGSWLLCSCRVPTGTVFLSLHISWHLPGTQAGVQIATVRAMSWCTVLKWELRLESFSSPVMGSSVLGGQVGYRAWEPRVPFANLAP